MTNHKSHLGVPCASRPGDGGVPEGHHCLGGQGVGGLGVEADVLGGVELHQLGVGVCQQLHALCRGVVPYGVRQAEAVLPRKIDVQS